MDVVGEGPFLPVREEQRMGEVWEQSSDYMCSNWLGNLWSDFITIQASTLH